RACAVLNRGIQNIVVPAKAGTQSRRTFLKVEPQRHRESTISSVSLCLCVSVVLPVNTERLGPSFRGDHTLNFIGVSGCARQHASKMRPLPSPSSGSPPLPQG